MAQPIEFSAGLGPRFALIGALVLPSSLLAACGDEQSCQASSAPPAVFVIDAETLQPICDGEVEIKDGDYEETITYGGGTDCTGLYLLPIRAGTYTTFVSSQSFDYAITATQITLGEGGCGGFGPENAGPQNGLPGRPNAVTVTLTKL